MITLRKLRSLREKTALRKCAALLQGFEADLAGGRQIDMPYLLGIFEIAGASQGIDLSDLAVQLQHPEKDDVERILRLCNRARHRLATYLGNEPADWDMNLVGASQRESRCILPYHVYLEDLRSPFNVGAIFRTAESFCIREIILSEDCPRPDHPRARRSSMGTADLVPWSISDLASLKALGPVFTLELGGVPLDEFEFPSHGTVIVGSEELGCSPAARELADASHGRVSIPMYGSKGSLNVSAAFAILAHAWRNAAAGPGPNRGS